MPYRRLPTSDNARLVAIYEIVKRVGDLEKQGKEIAIMPKTKKRVLETWKKFRKEMKEKKSSFTEQTKSSKRKTETVEKLRTFISQFIQVFNFGVARGEFMPQERQDFGLDQNQESLPELRKEGEVIAMAFALMDGEKMRVGKGGKPMQNPDIRYIEDAFREYQDAEADYNKYKEKAEDESDEVEALRDEVMSVIKRCWDEVEFYYSELTDEKMRKSSMYYGVTYVSRPGEKPEEGVLKEEESDYEKPLPDDILSD